MFNLIIICIGRKIGLEHQYLKSYTNYHEKINFLLHRLSCWIWFFFFKKADFSWVRALFNCLSEKWSYLELYLYTIRN